ncbi:MAG TPA: hypothetical protein VMU07_03365 [Candidatus Paceibacterota bacterium]|nr:hypothetical protein [Candidatus Paceibacterota bacterium]
MKKEPFTRRCNHFEKEIGKTLLELYQGGWISTTVVERYRFGKPHTDHDRNPRRLILVTLINGTKIHLLFSPEIAEHADRYWGADYVSLVYDGEKKFLQASDSGPRRVWLHQSERPYDFLEAIRRRI